MPFGKYHGCELHELPDSYVKWLWLKVDLREPLRNEILREYKLRFDYGNRPNKETALTTIDANRIKQIYRNLACQYHPDRIGGNGDVMKGINVFYEAIKT
ncbi:MAG: hypothetical protein GYA69_02045 [Candidatus Moranbacteria bacterium]|jgi:hypothetical protein|nr:hypothetical protein [Candidatus Moranbacteria bacterium]